MGFTNPIVGGSGTLIRPAIKSPDYAPGVSGWQIARDGTAEFNDVTARGSLQSPNYVAGSAGWAVKTDGSAEFNNVTARGEFATGQAGGTTAYVTMDDATDRSTISMWNKEGNDRAYINSPRAGDGTPGVAANTGTYPISGATQGFSRIYLDGVGAVQVGTVRGSDQTTFGGEFYANDTFASVRHAPLGGAHTGGELYIDSTTASLEYDSAGVSLHGVEATSTGVRGFGTFLSSSTATFTAGAGWSISEDRVDRWGPFVCVHLMLTRTGADIAAGNIADVTIATLSGDRPQSQTSCAAQWFAGTAAVSLDSAGNMALRWLASLLATGDALRIDAAYFKP